MAVFAAKPPPVIILFAYYPAPVSDPSFMFTPARTIVLAILLLILIIASWSKLRIVDEDDHEPQRWRIEEHPAFRKDEKRKETTGAKTEGSTLTSGE